MSAAAALRSIALASQAETFVVNAIRDATDCWLEDVRTRRAVQRQSDAAVNDENRKFVLGTGKAEPDALLAGEQRSLGELVNDRCKLVVVEHAVIEVRCVLDRLFAGMGEGDSASALATQRVEQSKIIASRNADRASDLVALSCSGSRPAKNGRAARSSNGFSCRGNDADKGTA